VEKQRVETGNVASPPLIWRGNVPARLFHSGGGEATKKIPGKNSRDPLFLYSIFNYSADGADAGASPPSTLGAVGAAAGRR
jgi:hypothetical protein